MNSSILKRHLMSSAFSFFLSWAYETKQIISNLEKKKDAALFKALGNVQLLHTYFTSVIT